MTHSDETLDLAVRIAQGVWQTRAADLITTAIRGCEMLAQPLSEEQTAQLLIALAEASDGVQDSIHSLLDADRARSIMRGLSA